MALPYSRADSMRGELRFLETIGWMEFQKGSVRLTARRWCRNLQLEMILDWILIHDCHLADGARYPPPTALRRIRAPSLLTAPLLNLLFPALRQGLADFVMPLPIHLHRLQVPTLPLPLRLHLLRPLRPLPQPRLLPQGQVCQLL